MPVSNFVLLKKEDRIAFVILNRPKVLNALNTKVLQELLEKIEICAQDARLRAVILKGTNDNFAAGADISELASSRGIEGAREFHQLRELTFAKIEGLHCPTIALIDGYALGTGLELALTCDLRVGTERAKFGVPSGKLGVVESYEYIGRLTSLVGASWAKTLLYTAEMIDAETARMIGLINYIAPAGEIGAFVQQLAGKMIKNSPQAVTGSKKVVNECIKQNWKHISEPGSPLLSSIGTPDFIEGTSAFLEKRKPNFK